jgi:hypothetical protein
MRSEAAAPAIRAAVPSAVRRAHGRLGHVRRTASRYLGRVVARAAAAARRRAGGSDPMSP